MNAKATILFFDKTFEGYLTAVYAAFREKLEVIDLQPVRDKNPLLFHEVRHIATDRQKARRVWNALSEKGSANLRLVYFAFLSENEELLLPIYEFIVLLFKGDTPESSKNFSALRSKLGPWAQRVENEKRKLEMSLRFRHGQGEMKWCRLRPVYNVLPLLTRYCRMRFGSAPWMLIDTKRKYGLRKNVSGVEHFVLSVEPSGVTKNYQGSTRVEKDLEFINRDAHPLQAAV